MSLPKFTGEASFCKTGQHYSLVTPKGATFFKQAITVASLPQECLTTPGASRPWTDTTCIGVVQFCQDKCRVPDPRVGPAGREVSGSWYLCGACFGFPF